MPKKHRPNLRQKAKKIAEFLRSRVLDERGWLHAQFLSHGLPVLLDSPQQKSLRFAVLRGWLTVEKTTSRGSVVSAHFLENGASMEIAKSAAEKYDACNGRGDWRASDGLPAAVRTRVVLR